MTNILQKNVILEKRLLPFCCEYSCNVCVSVYRVDKVYSVIWSISQLYQHTCIKY